MGVSVPIQTGLGGLALGRLRDVVVVVGRRRRVFRHGDSAACSVKHPVECGDGRVMSSRGQVRAAPGGDGEDYVWDQFRHGGFLGEGLDHSSSLRFTLRRLSLMTRLRPQWGCLAPTPGPPRDRTIGALPLARCSRRH